MSTPSAVHVHVHLAAAGSFPLRVCDLLFTDSVLVVPEYAHCTPLGLARGGLTTAGERARDCYHERGLEGLLELATHTRRVTYDGIDHVSLYDGRGARPKVAVHVDDGPPYAYRIHAPVEVDQLTEALRSLGDRRGFGVERRDGAGFSLTNSLRRFLADR